MRQTWIETAPLGAMQAPRKRWYECFEPLIPAFVGVLVGSVVHAYLLQITSATLPAWKKSSLDVAARLYMFLFAVVTWSILTIYRRRRLHCGGQMPLDVVPFRYIIEVVGAIGGLIAGAVVLTHGHIGLFFIVTCPVLAVYAAEIGCEWRLFFR